MGIHARFYFRWSACDAAGRLMMTRRCRPRRERQRRTQEEEGGRGGGEKRLKNIKCGNGLSEQVLFMRALHRGKRLHSHASGAGRTGARRVGARRDGETRTSGKLERLELFTG